MSLNDEAFAGKTWAELLAYASIPLLSGLIGWGQLPLDKHTLTRTNTWILCCPCCLLRGKGKAPCFLIRAPRVVLGRARVCTRDGAVRGLRKMLGRGHTPCTRSNAVFCIDRVHARTYNRHARSRARRESMPTIRVWQTVSELLCWGSGRSLVAGRVSGVCCHRSRDVVWRR